MFWRRSSGAHIPFSMIRDLLAEVTDQSGIISPTKLRSVLHIRMKDIAELAQVHRNTLHRNPGAPAVQARLATITRILLKAAQITNDPALSITWFKFQPLEGLDGKTAAELVCEGHGEAVFHYLEMVEHGKRS